MISYPFLKQRAPPHCTVAYTSAKQSIDRNMMNTNNKRTDKNKLLIPKHLKKRKKKKLLRLCQPKTFYFQVKINFAS